MPNRNEPYVGPRPFEQADKDFFFGRNQESNELISLIIAHPVLLLYAPSGAGKTSLLKAQIIPALDETEEFDMLPPTRVRAQDSAALEDEKIKNIYMYNALKDLSNNQLSPIERAHMTLAEYLKKRPRALKKPDSYASEVDNQATEQRLPRAIIFDQLEELFTFFPERYKDRQNFFEQIVDALEEDTFLRVIISMREDYIAEMDPYVDILPEKLRTRFRLERLREQTALTAVIEPLKAEGLKIKRQFAPGVAEKLITNLLKVRVISLTGQVKEVKGEFVDPVQLQVVCQTLWENLTSNETTITEKHLEKFGDVNQALINFYEKCIQKAVEAANKQRKENEPELKDGVLRGWIERVLITREGTRGIIFRGHGDRISGMPVEAVEELESQHLIRAELRGGQVWYELSHDRFIQPILESNRRHLLKQPLAKQKGEELEKKAIEWLDAGRPDNLLLDAGALSDAQSWIDSPEGQTIGYGETLFSLVTASQTAADQVENKRNQLLLEEQKLRLEAETLRAADERRRYKQLKLGITLLALFFLAAVILTIFSVQQAYAISKALGEVTKANKQTQEARTQVMAANDKLESQNETLIQKNSELEEERQKVKKASDAAIDERDKALKATKLADIARKEAEKAQADLLIKNTKLNEQTGLLSNQASKLKQQSLDLALNQTRLETQNKELNAAKSIAEREVLKNRAKVLYMDADRLNKIEDYESSARLSLAAMELSTTASIQDLLRDTLRRVSDIPYDALKPNDELLGRFKKFSGAYFSPDGTTILTTSTDGPVLIWKRVDSKWVQTAQLSANLSQTAELDFSTDNRNVITAHEDGVMRMWNTDSGQLVREFKGHTRAIHALAFSPDGRYIATEAMDGTGRIWDAATGTSLAVLNDLQGPAASIAFSPDGKRLVTEVEKKDADDVAVFYGARVWTVPEGKEVFTLKDSTDPASVKGAATSVSYSPDGKYLLIKNSGGSVKVWDANRGNLIAIIGDPRNLVDSAYFSPNSKYIAAIIANRIQLLELRGGKWVNSSELRETTDQITALAFSPDSSLIVTSSQNTAKVWDVRSLGVVSTLKGHSGGILSIAFAPISGKKLVLTASLDNTARVWDVGDHGATTGVTRAILRQPGLILDAEVGQTLNQQFIITSGSSSAARIWDMTGRVKRVLSHPSSLYRSSFSLDGQYAATTCKDGIVRIWEWRDDKKAAIQIQAQAYDVAFSPDGKIVATANYDGSVTLWDWKSQPPKLLRKMTGNYSVLSVAFNTQGNLIVTASIDGTVRVWNVSDGSQAAEPFKIQGKVSVANKAVFSPDGESIAIAATDQAARIWKWKQNQSPDNPVVLCGHTGVVYSIAFNSTGDLIVTASGDKTARVWDVKTGRSIAILRGHTSEVYSAVFSATSNFVLTASADSTARIYPQEEYFQSIEELRSLAEKKKVRKLTPEELNAYLSESDESCSTKRP